MSRNKLEKVDTCTLSELQLSLSHCIERIMAGDMPADVGKTIASLGSVKISGARAKMRLEIARNEKPESDFLQG